jgi:hypothetical protein
MGIWKNVVSQVGGLAKHAAKTVVSEPLEIVKDAVGEKIEQGVQTTQQSDDPTAQTNQLDELAKAGFKTQDDFKKYEGLSGKKDDIEMQLLRKQLVREWGLDTNLESGMKQAQMEYEQKEERRKQVEEQKEEQEKEFEFQQKQAEDAQVVAAQRESNPENKAWGAG